MYRPSDRSARFYISLYRDSQRIMPAARSVLA
jgi:hypothetical protein